MRQKWLTGCILLALVSVAVAVLIPLGRPFGKSITVSTTPTRLQFTQTPSATLISDGSFATNTYWDFGLDFTWSADSSLVDFASTNRNDSLTQSNLLITSTYDYRLIYTISAWATGEIQAILGGSPDTARSADGTYTSTVTAGGRDRNLSFVPTSTYTTNNMAIDDVSLALLQPGLARGITLYNEGTSTVYYLVNCDTNEFNRAYADSSCPELPVGMTVTLPLHAVDQGYGSMVHRTAAGVSTLKVTAE
jgi:hypothetical protein